MPPGSPPITAASAGRCRPGVLRSLETDDFADARKEADMADMALPGVRKNDAEGVTGASELVKES